jgi:hypothetical protein
MIDWFQPGRIGRQLEQTDIAWTRGFSPVLWRPSLQTGSIEEQYGVTVLRRLAAELLDRQVHRLGGGIRQDQGPAGIATRADGAEYLLSSQ